MLETKTKYTGTKEDLAKISHEERCELLACTLGIFTGGSHTYVLGTCEYLLNQEKLYQYVTL